MQMGSTQLARVLQCVPIVYVLVAPVVMGAQNQLFGIDGTLVTPAGMGACSQCTIRLEDERGRDPRSTLSNLLGNFSFNNLEVGVYTLRVQEAGFKVTMQVVSVNTDRARVSIELEAVNAASDADRNEAGAGQVIDISTFRDGYPKLAVELYERASERNRKHQSAEAMRLFEEAIAIAPNFYAAHTELGITYESLGMLGEAGKAFQAAGRINLSSPDPMIHLGGVHILRNEWGPAAQASLDAIRRDPQEPRGYFQLGLALYCTSVLDLAESALRTTLNLDPKVNDVRLLLANLYLQSGKWNDALQQLDRYLQSSPSGEAKSRVSALQTRLRRGERPVGVRLAVPIRVGGTVRPDVCGSP